MENASPPGAVGNDISLELNSLADGRVGLSGIVKLVGGSGQDFGLTIRYYRDTFFCNTQGTF